MLNENTKNPDLKVRTASYALRIVKMYRALTRDEMGRVLGRQVLRSGTSVGAHYREGRRARSVAEFVSKLEAATQELDETAYRLELLLVAAGAISATRVAALIKETDEIMSILVASIKTAKKSRI